MGKRNKKVEIILKDEELIPTTIGFFEEEKRGLLVLIILFIIFILFALFLPDITTYVNRFLGKNEDIVITSSEEENKEEIDNENNLIMYDLKEDLEFTYNDIAFSNFNKYQLKNSYYLSIKLNNNSKNIIDFSKNRYYLETYNSEKTLLNRHIFNNDVLSINSSGNQTIELTEEEFNNLSKIIITSKTEEDYEEITLNLDANNQYILKCSKNKNNIIYIFDKNEKLTRIKDTINYLNDKSNEYNQSLNFYQSQVANYNNKDGVSSSLVEISTGFTVTTDISVTTANIKELSNDNYYTSDVIPKVVNFEMESRGYSCQ